MRAFKTHGDDHAAAMDGPDRDVWQAVGYLLLLQ